MKATIVLIAGNEAENFGRKMMLKAHQYGNVGFEMARLPQHVSLKQPFIIPNLEDMELFFDEFVNELSPIDIEFVDIDLFPSNIIGGISSGVISLRVKSTPQLITTQKVLNEKLYNQFGPCPADHDNDYIFHMTIAIGKADFEKYKTAYNKLKKEDYKKVFTFNKIGLLYYDDDNINPGTYFCYKICDIR